MFISDCNRIVYQFVQAYTFSSSPSITIVYGQEGLGKTTFLTYLHKRMKDQIQQSLFIDANKFSTKYAFAAQHGNLSAFRKKIRSYQLLLIDNIHDLKGKEKTIEELFHTVETILTQGGKVVISYQGDSPCFLFLGERFGSRLHAAIAIPLLKPTLQEKAGFIDQYLTTKTDIKNTLTSARSTKIITESHNFTEIIEHIEQSGISHLQGYSSHVPANKGIEKKLKSIHSCVSEYYGIDESVIRSRAKKPKVVEARYMVYLILHELCHYTYSEIAKYYDKNTSILTKNCLRIKESSRESFETLCQKLYNQL